MLTTYRRALTLFCALGISCLLAPAGITQDAKDVKDPSVERMKRDIFFLASDACEGRGIGTLGLDLAAQYIAVQFSQAGLKPGGVNGTYFQPFPFATGAKLDGVSTLVFENPNGKKVELKQGTDFQVINTSGPGKVNAPIVFVGYGTSWSGVALDEYANVDVKGKVVIALRRLPRWNDKNKPLMEANKDSAAALETKQMRAYAHGAAAIILVNDTTEMPKDIVPPFGFSRISTVPTPYVHMKRAFLHELFQGSIGKSLEDVEKAIDADLKSHSAELKGWTAHIDVKLKRNEVQIKNVIGYLDGSGPLANETVVVGSHYDHLGYGAFGGMIGKQPKAKTIYYGADDNGSGTTSNMELARRFAAKKGTEGRKMVFMAYTAEEMGLIGSRHFTQAAPLFPLSSVSAMFNLDMVGKLDPRIVAIDDKTVTVTYEGQPERKDKLVKSCKFYHMVHGEKVELKDGVNAEVFKKIPAGGLRAGIAWDFGGNVLAITVASAPVLLVEGFNTAKEFDSLVTKLNPGFEIVKKNSRGFVASDQYNFYVQNVPVIFFWTGEHPDYHRPGDIPERINVVGMKKVADYAELVINDLRTNPKRPEYTPVGKGVVVGGGGPTQGPSFRFQPDYLFAGKGVLIDKITEGGPAEKAGLKEGDIIIEIAGRAVTNNGTYMAIRATLKAGVEIEIKILRNKKEMTLKITPVNFVK